VTDGAFTTTVHGPSHALGRPDLAPRNLGPCPSAGDRGRRWLDSLHSTAAPGRDRAHDADRSQYKWGYMGGTTPALRRSLGPFQPVQCHLTLAFHSPPSMLTNIHYLPPGKPPASSSAHAATSSTAERAPTLHRRTRPTGEACPKRGPGGRYSQTHGRAL
jgi:hypothetical protein